MFFSKRAEPTAVAGAGNVCPCRASASASASHVVKSISSVVLQWTPQKISGGKDGVGTTVPIPFRVLV